MISGLIKVLLTVSLAEGFFTDNYILPGNRRCLNCNNVTHPLDCTTVTECGRNEVCYVRKYIYTRGDTREEIFYYDMGCWGNMYCMTGLTATVIGKRDKNRRAVMCMQCCGDQDICNLDHLCVDESVKHAPGSKMCFNCPYSNKMDDCNQVTLCDQDSSCLIQQTTNHAGESKWTQKCIRTIDCSSIITSQPHGMCVSCCDGNLCNNNCTLPLTTTTLSTTTTPIPLSPPVITSITIDPPFIHFGDNVRVECIATGNEKPTVEFLFMSTSLAGNVHLNPLGPTSNILTITHFLPINQGVYGCIANNSQGNVAKEFSLTGQVYQASPPVITSIIIDPPVIHFGDDVRVECIATGNEKPTVDFLFMNTSLAGNVHLNPLGPTSNILTITHFLPMDEGVYGCIATNSQGNVAKEFSLTGH